MCKCHGDCFDLMLAMTQRQNYTGALMNQHVLLSRHVALKIFVGLNEARVLNIIY